MNKIIFKSFLMLEMLNDFVLKELTAFFKRKITEGLK
jgi:hypothetical protein